MTSNAYTNPNATDWYPLDRFPDNNTLPFGWEPDADGFRGHVFVSEDNSTVVVSVKGTSAGWMVGGGGPTVAKDKLNDNLLFSCCCAKVGPTWSPVCGCHQGGYKCGQTCLERSLADDSLFYSVGINLYNNVTYMYPNANIWMIGHSLGGSLASLIGNTFGAPVVTFEAPPEKLAATRLHLPTPPSAQHITHVFHTADPIAMGTCNGVRSLCAIGGYAMESKCHMGTIVKYDTITDLGWSADSRTHGILVIIERLLGTDWWREKHGDASEGETSDGRAKDREVPAPTLDEDCVDCFDWEFVEDFGTGVGLGSLANRGLSVGRRSFEYLKGLNEAEINQKRTPRISYRTASMPSRIKDIPASDPRFVTIKKDIASSHPAFKEQVTKAWAEIIAELDQVTKAIVSQGPLYIPEIKFSDLAGLNPERIEEIRKKGCVVIRDLVDDDEAIKWKDDLKEFVKTNPDVEVIPRNHPIFYELYWTKPQLAARAHPNMLAASVWFNNLFHSKSGQNIDGVDMSAPLTYADRVRIRSPGPWPGALPPHVDGATLERWEEPNMRVCFKDILSGDWRSHDPYDLDGRLEALTSLYNRPNQCSVFRTFQGWLSMSNTGPKEGTIKFFPSVQVANAYTMLRPFFRHLVPVDSPDIWDAKNWIYDVESPEFPGIVDLDGGYYQRPTTKAHPHLRLEETLTSAPAVKPGDAVFWHCDVIHAVEVEHEGTQESAVMYIPAVPTTPRNKAYVTAQYERFVNGIRPADFPQGPSERQFVGVGTPEDVVNVAGRKAMAIPV
ncbi:hypothetical protein EYR40_007547 [Pleurotus pulmonarius]|nr:hypothetical protein EYR40_007547 [Pleurotus pulmonarius]